jgi:Concanavalin A-like lectin/glucanases superfamily/Secretion system C-terminal sorting domain
MRHLLSNTVTLLTSLLLCLNIFYPPPMFSQIPTNGLVVWYPFSGNANDGSGYGYDGVVDGATLTTDRFGSANSAYSFNGNSITVSNSAGLSFWNYTFSAWILDNGPSAPTAGAYHTIIAKYGNFDFDNTYAYDFSICYDTISLGRDFKKLMDARPDWSAYSTTQINNGTWQHVAVTVKSNDTATIWINGVPSGSQLYPNSLYETSYPTTIGSIRTSKEKPFIGKIDDIRIYNRALSAAEIDTLFHERGWMGSVYLVSPTSGAIGVVNPTLTWNAYEGNPNYRLQISTDSTFQTTKYDLDWITATSKSISGLSHLTRYYWRVYARNARGTSNWSSVWSFVTSDITWKIDITASSNGIEDPSSYAAVGGIAKDGFDSLYDFPKPPIPSSNFVYVYFSHPEWGYLLGPNFYSDVKLDTVLSSKNQVWTFNVATDQLNKPMSLCLLPSVEVPSSYSVLLRDMKTDSVQDIRVNNVYSYGIGSDFSRAFQLIISGIKSESYSYNPGWNLVGFPIRTNSTLRDSVIAEGPATYLFDYSKDSSYYSARILNRGKGYWLGTTSPVTATVEGTTVMDSVSVPLNAGFNMISLPYLDFNYSKHALAITDGNTVVSFDSAVSLAWVSPVLYSYQTIDESYSYIDTLISWNGYCFAAIQSSLQLIFNPSANGSVFSTQSISSSLNKKLNTSTSDPNWFVKMTLQGEKSVDRLGGFGITAGTKNGFDARYDLPHPPNPPSSDYVYLVFPHPEWGSIVGPNFSADVRSPGSSNLWNLRVGSAKKTTASLKWDTAMVPAGATLEITDLGNKGTTINMKKASSYQFTLNGIDSLQIFSVITEVSQPLSTIPTTYALSQNYPNPFNPSTKIGYQLPKSSFVTLKVYDIIGREVSMLVNETQNEGTYEVTFDASHLASGVYFYRLQAGSFVQTKKLVVVK